MLWKHKVAKSILVLVVLASIANILYILGVLPEMTVKIGFVTILLSSCIISLCGINKKDKRKEYKDSLYSGFGICSLLIWLATYAVAIFVN